MKILERDLDYYLDPDFKNLNEVINLPFGVGKSFKGQFPKDVTVIVKSKLPLPDFIICGAMYIVSRELKEVFENAAESEAEFFPINVWLRKVPYTQQEFYCFNPLNEIDAMNYQKSIYIFEEDNEFIDSIEKLIIDESKVKGLNYFHVDNIEPLFVSDKIAEEIIKRKLIGIQLINIEDFRGR